MDNHKGKGKIIYLTPEEKKILEKKAKKANLNLAKYIKKMAINGEISVTDVKEIIKINFEINKIGSNINQIAKKINENNYAYKTDIEIIKIEFDKLKEKILEYLKKD